MDLGGLIWIFIFLYLSLGVQYGYSFLGMNFSFLFLHLICGRQIRVRSAVLDCNNVSTQSLGPYKHKRRLHQLELSSTTLPPFRRKNNQQHIVLSQSKKPTSTDLELDLPLINFPYPTPSNEKPPLIIATEITLTLYNTELLDRKTPSCPRHLYRCILLLPRYPIL